MGHAHEDRPFVSRRNFLRGSALVGASAAAGPWVWQQPAYAADTPVLHAHLNFGADASRDMTVSWMTPAAVQNPFVEAGKQRVAEQTTQYLGYPATSTMSGWTI
jgi:hypothetical protein